MSVTLDGMQLIVTRNILKHACGAAMFCGDCKRVLDAPRAVLVETDRGSTLGVLCAPCWDALGVSAEQARTAGRMEITDGRELWPARKPSAAVRKPSAAVLARAPRKRVAIGDVWTTRAGSTIVRVRVVRDRGTRAAVHGGRKRWLCTELDTGRTDWRSTAALRSLVEHGGAS